MVKRFMGSAVLSLLLAGCLPGEEELANDAVTFGSDLAFLQAQGEVVVLSDDEGQAQVVVSPAMQGRVLTSTASGNSGPSFGWINRELIASGERWDHINVFGGEDRFWLGPEGGQFSIYFKEGDPFDLDHWYVPSGIDWDPWEITAREPARVAMGHDMQLTNYSGTVFELRVDREVRLLNRVEAAAHLGVELDASLDLVAFESVNTITNTGQDDWTREGGLLSIWILGMYSPSPATSIVIPYRPAGEAESGRVVNDAYFGEVPANRLIVDDDVVYFKGDGAYRAKIGLSKARSRPTFGSYDALSRVLTLVQYTMPEGESDYVNSMWELQEDPYAGDVVNSYNDGPPAPGVPPLGPFYELETSSPAAALEVGASLTHVHRTLHMQGAEEWLDRVAAGTLGSTLDEIRSALIQQE